MSPSPWSGPAGPWRGGSDAEIELLQTDVMRFLAILALCLVAIFALVQSLPTEAPDPRPRIEHSATLHEEITLLRARVAHLQRVVTALRLKLSEEAASRREGEQDLLQAHKAQRAAAEALAGAHRAGEQLAAERAALAAELEVVQQQAAKREARLQRLEQRLAARTRSLASVRARLEAARAAQVRAEAHLATLAAQTAPRPTAGAPPLAEPHAPAMPEEPKREHFTLRFASDEALKTLMARGQVALYARVGAAAWRLEVRAGRTEIHPAPVPRRYHEMTAATVPAELVAALRLAGGVRTPRPTWAVTLPSDMQRQLQSRMRAASGGDLVIEADGSVHHER